MINCLILGGMLASSVISAGAATEPSAPSATEARRLLVQWNQAVQTTIEKDFYFAQSGFYGEDVVDGNRPQSMVFNWGLGVMFSSLTASAKVDKRYKTQLEGFITRARAYWNDAPPVAGFDVHPVPRYPDRYYDDNQWMCLNQIEAYEIFRNPLYLTQAIDTYKYIMSGESADLGGGIFWKEREKTSKNTCSNGPAAYCAVRLYELTKKPEFLKDALRIYAWTDKNLRDPADGLFWDNIDLKGKVEKTKWSYNTALMLKTESALLALKADPSFTKEKRDRHARAALAKWMKSDGSMADEAKFAHMLVEAVLDCNLPEYGWREAFKTAEYVQTKVRDVNGRFANRWDEPAKGPWKRVMMLDMASVSRLYAYVLSKIPNSSGPN